MVGGKSSEAREGGTYIFCAPYFSTACSSSLLRSFGFDESFVAVAFELRCACDVSIWLMTVHTRAKASQG